MALNSSSMSIYRLLITELNKDGQLVGLAVIYLNEYRVASSAFTLHSQEAKVLKVLLILMFMQYHSKV